MQISELKDYPAIKKLALSLHQLDTGQHGAAIMIGAGFSRSAAQYLDGSKKMPLWYNFTKKLLAELNPNDTDSSFSDPLRIAEEFRAYFGQAVLNDRIRSEIEDETWRPGPLYQSLLSLPWSEIMTTNWDTLLERAAENIHGPYYTPVTKPVDLTWAQSPRIVKLHGTIGITDCFIAAQEDYRTYPHKFAPFVNFTRQVFIENELCLLGFSGDDPNFLHWAGWVRDHLAGNARKIYLVGALNLTAARRKHLESMNISPVDLFEAVKHFDDRDLQHQKAMELFIQAMIDEGKSKAEPQKWIPTSLFDKQDGERDFHRQFKDPEYAASLLKNQISILKKDRETYPGWLVCPPKLQSQIKGQINNPRPSEDNISALDPKSRAQILYEIAWRYSVTFEYIPYWLLEKLHEVAKSEVDIGISRRQQIEIALILLKSSRWLSAEDDNDEVVIQEHIASLTSLIEKNADYLPDTGAELAYHQALVARDELDYPKLEELVDKICGEDSIWKLRQASILIELGRADESHKLISMAYGELREKHRLDRHSIPIFSRFLWAHFLLKASQRSSFSQTVEDLPPFAESHAKKWESDPQKHFNFLEESAGDQKEKFIKGQNLIEPLFGQGSYREGSSQQAVFSDTSTFLLLEGVTRDVGVPLRASSGGFTVNLLANVVEELVLAGGCGVESWNFNMAFRAAHDEKSPSIKNFFTRIGVAQASQEAVDVYVDRFQKAIPFWVTKRINGSKSQQGHAISILKNLMEILARLVVRVSTEKAKEIFKLAVKLGQERELQHHWLFEVFDSLLTNSIGSIPNSEQGDILIEALDFPLPNEVGANAFPRWPNPVINFPHARDNYPKLKKRLDEIIEAAAAMDTASSDALVRLTPLSKKENFLSKSERRELLKILWGEHPNFEKLPQVGFIYAHVWLQLPNPDAKKVKELIRAYLYDHDETVLDETLKDLKQYPSPAITKAMEIYGGIANAAANKQIGMLPKTKQALTLFNRIVKWRLRDNPEDIFGGNNIERKRLLETLGNALSYSIVPALSIKERNLEKFQKLELFYREAQGAASSTLPALVYFVTHSVEVAGSVELVIRKSMLGKTSREVGYAVQAIFNWMKLSHDDSKPHLHRMIDRLIASIESGRLIGLHQVLWVARELLCSNRLSSEQIDILIEAIPNIFIANDYSEINPNSTESITTSSVREECIKLASELLKLRPESLELLQLIEQSKEDALPEVRFALLQA